MDIINTLSTINSKSDLVQVLYGTGSEDNIDIDVAPVSDTGVGKHQTELTSSAALSLASFNSGSVGSLSSSVEINTADILIVSESGVDTRNSLGALKNNVSGLSTKVDDNEVVLDTVSSSYDSFSQSVITDFHTKKITMGDTVAGDSSFAMGFETDASGSYSHAEGYKTTANGWASHAEGWSTNTNATASHAEGYQTTASAAHSHVEGYRNVIKSAATYAHAEGGDNTIFGLSAHVEGDDNIVIGDAAHAEGYQNSASAHVSHVEGMYNIAGGVGSHAEGHYNITMGSYSHAEGYGTITNEANQHTSGEYNITGSGALIIGNGADDANRANALTLDWNGNLWTSGNITATDEIRFGTTAATASADNVGSMRYREDGRNPGWSKLEVCMQTSSGGYGWVIIERYDWGV